MPYESIWQILGLEGPTRDITEIKKAYAAKAKITNPEDDPEGFEKLHTAYRSAVNIARSGRAVKPVVVVSPPSGEQQAAQPSYDYSKLNIPIPGFDDEITEFKRINKIQTKAQIRHHKDMARVSLAKELTAKYRSYAYTRSDKEVWKKYWEEPLVQYFKGDPKFRQWLLETTRVKIHNEALTELTADCRNVHSRWTVKPLAATAPPLTRRQELLIAAFCTFVGSPLFVFVANYNNFGLHLMKEIIFVALGTGFIMFGSFYFERHGGKYIEKLRDRIRRK